MKTDIELNGHSRLKLKRSKGMIMKFTTILIYMITVIALDFYFPDFSEACTSFAVYSQHVYYGMNFDFVDLPMKFLITANGDMRTFHLAFQRTIGDISFFVHTAGMNDKGLFSACQELYPVNLHPREKTATDMYTFELYETIAFYSSVGEIEKHCQDRPLVDMPGITLHNLFADSKGRAMVTEAGERETQMVQKTGKFIVMTNFANQSMTGKTYAETQGKGQDRYIICHAYLERHASDFRIENGFELLSMCRNKDPEYPTVCSMIFDPQNREVYIVVKRDFSRIWKLSIDNHLIETWRGFKTDLKIPIPIGENGIPASDLRRY